MMPFRMCPSPIASKIEEDQSLFFNAEARRRGEYLPSPAQVVRPDALILQNSEARGPSRPTNAKPPRLRVEEQRLILLHSAGDALSFARVAALLHRLAPGAVGKVPRRGGADTGFKIIARPPPELPAYLVGID